MIKFAIERDGRPLYGFGLSHMNIEKLKAGQPIVVDLAQLGGHGEVMIFAGATEDAMLAELRAAGLLPAAAAVRSDG